MPHLSGILGSASDPSMRDPIHDLAHKGKVEHIVLPSKDTARRRLRATTDRGTECTIALSREERLYNGAVLWLEDDLAIVVRVEDENWLRLHPTSSANAIQLGYHAGNLHWRVRFDRDDLLVALEGPETDYIERLSELVQGGGVVVGMTET
ncbi:MAG: urease accessory protein UreE [Minwuia sp.]|uniref:urease accessory protein UreE n=1 Tax=Minwuia sp. TaxID=2493630 RepID=UPI003A8A24E9